MLLGDPWRLGGEGFIFGHPLSIQFGKVNDMKNLVRLAVISVLLLSGCVQQTTSPNANQTSQGSGDAAFKKVHDDYVVEFLRRNPTINTYLGGAGLDPKLREVDWKLRDHSTTALEDEDRWLTSTKQSL